MVEVFHNAIIGVLNMVALPAFARLQAQPRRLRAAIARTTLYACLIAFPVTVGLALVAGPLVHALFRPVWHDAAPVLAILAAFGVVIPARVVVSAALRAVGRPDLALRLAAVAFVLRAGASLAAIAAGWGLSGVALLGSAAQAVLLPARARTLMAASGMTVARYFGAMALPAAAALAMAAAVYAVRLGLEPHAGAMLLLAAMVVTGMAVYAGVCVALAPHLPARLLRHVRR
jgi:PST family polysaccharide transporter/lipopolysaccharide exporter